MAIDHRNEAKLPTKSTWKNLWFPPIAGISLLVLFVGIVGIIALPFIFPAIVHKSLFLAEGKDSYESWKKTPIPITFKVYIFNVTNPEEVTWKGAIPNVQEIGPYVFKQYRSKNVLSWNAGEKSVTYSDVKRFHFEPSMSKSLDERVYSVNLPLQGILTFTKRLSFLASSVVNPTLEVLFAKHEENLFVYRTARELLFEGYKVDILEEFVQLLRPFADVPDILLPNNTFGFLYGKNNSGDGVFTVYTGEDDIRKYTKIVRWNNQREVRFWRDDFCNMINGTDGAQFPPPVGKDDSLYAFAPDLCRSVYLVYESDAEVRGIPAYRFVTPQRLFASPFQNPDNLCYCTEAEYCALSGILDASPCRNGLKLAMTAPHLYLADDSVRRRVTGLHPSAASHRTFVDVEPSTGLVLRASRKLQANFIVQPVKTFSQTRNVRMSVVPLIWVAEEAEIDADVADLFNARVRTPVTVARAVLFACIVLGLLWIASAGLVGFCALKKQPGPAENGVPRRNKAVPSSSGASNKKLWE